MAVDWKRNLKNASTFLKVNLAQVEAFEAGDRDFNPLAYALRLANPAAKFISSKLSIPLRFFKHYFHMHGDKGSNGTSGSNANFKSLGFDIAAADDHSPSQHRQLTRLGNIIDTPPYAQGVNTWGHSFGIEHPDGSMQLIPIVDGKWRA